MKLSMYHLGLQPIIVWVYLYLFNGIIKFWNSDFSKGKSENSGFLETFAACDLNKGKCNKLDELIKVYEYSRSRSFLDFGPRSFIYQN